MDVRWFDAVTILSNVDTIILVENGRCRSCTDDASSLPRAVTIIHPGETPNKHAFKDHIKGAFLAGVSCTIF